MTMRRWVHPHQQHEDPMGSTPGRAHPRSRPSGGVGAGSRRRLRATTRVSGAPQRPGALVPGHRGWLRAYRSPGRPHETRLLLHPPGGRRRHDLDRPALPRRPAPDEDSRKQALLHAEEESFRLAAVRVSSGPRASLPVGKLPPALLADLRVCDARRVAGSPHRIGRLRDRYPKRVPRGGNGSDHVHAAHTHARPSIVGSTPVLLLPEFHRSR